MTKKLEELIKAGRKWIQEHESADLTAEELRELISSYDDAAGTPGNASALYEIITAAYYAGIAAGSGSRATGEKSKMVRKVVFSASVDLSEAHRNHIKTVDDLRNYIMEKDTEPITGHAFRLSDPGAKAKALKSMKSAASASVFRAAGVFIQVMFSCLEYYTADESGEFLDGSDFDSFEEFTPEDEKNILNFLLW